MGTAGRGKREQLERGGGEPDGMLSPLVRPPPGLGARRQGARRKRLLERVSPISRVLCVLMCPVPITPIERAQAGTSRLLLTFGGADAALSVWLNGTPVGYSQDSKLPAEFDVTASARPGRNLVCAQVVRWCDGSYLEDQDMWWLSGLFRDVTLACKVRALRERAQVACPLCRRLCSPLTSVVPVFGSHNPPSPPSTSPTTQPRPRSWGPC